MRELAVRVYKAMGCRGMSRVDFFVKSDGEVVFNEINTIPGFTSISMYPKLFEASGIPYSDLLDDLIALALEAWWYRPQEFHHRHAVHGGRRAADTQTGDRRLVLL